MNYLLRPRNWEPAFAGLSGAERARIIWPSFLASLNPCSIEIVSQFVTFTGFPFDFAQGGEPVEPRISPREAALVRNDGLGEL